MTCIYGLYDRDGNLRYIGKANNPSERLKSHMRETNSGRRNYPVNAWIKKHGVPEMRVLVQDCTDWRTEEAGLIADARARGERLLNIADGGDQPHCTIEHRRSNAAKMNEALLSSPEKMAARELMVSLGHFLRSLKERGGYTRNWLDGMRDKAAAAQSARPDLFPNITSMVAELPEPNS